MISSNLKKAEEKRKSTTPSPSGSPSNEQNLNFKNSIFSKESQNKAATQNLLEAHGLA